METDYNNIYTICMQYRLRANSYKCDDDETTRTMTTFAVTYDKLNANGTCTNGKQGQKRRVITSYMHLPVYSFTRPNSQQSSSVQYSFQTFHYAINIDSHKRLNSADSTLQASIAMNTPPFLTPGQSIPSHFSLRPGNLQCIWKCRVSQNCIFYTSSSDTLP